jgi:hypothetical protein
VGPYPGRATTANLTQTPLTTVRHTMSRGSVHTVDISVETQGAINISPGGSRSGARAAWWVYGGQIGLLPTHHSGSPALRPSTNEAPPQMSGR